MKLFETITDLSKQSAELKCRRYGVIELVQGKLIGVHFRPWPKLIPLAESLWLGGWQHSHNGRKNDQCLIYYNQPLIHPGFLSIPYVVTSLATSFTTIRRSFVILDEVARIKNSDAIITEVTNSRITDRIMARSGWQPHLPSSRRRHFIRRFYGKFPDELQQQLELIAADQKG